MLLMGVLLCGCSPENNNDTPVGDVQEVIYSDAEYKGELKKYGYWIIDGTKVGECLVMFNDFRASFSGDGTIKPVPDNSNGIDLGATFSYVPWDEIVLRLMTDEALEGAVLLHDANNMVEASASLNTMPVGFSNNNFTVYYDFVPTYHDFRVAIDGETHDIKAGMTGTMLVTSRPGWTITANLTIAEITDNGMKKALSSPLKLVCVAQ